LRISDEALSWIIRWGVQFCTRLTWKVTNIGFRRVSCIQSIRPDRKNEKATRAERASIAYRKTRLWHPIDHPEQINGCRNQLEENNMKRQNARKPAAKGSRPHLRKAQGVPSESIESSKDDDMAPDQSLLVTTSRRIGSVLGKIVAATEQSFAQKQSIKLPPKKRISARRSRKAPVKRGTTKAR
jgi:hypothetical protein